MRGRPFWRPAELHPFRVTLLLSLPLALIVAVWLALSFRNFYNLTRVVPRKDASVSWYGTTPRRALLWTLTHGLAERPRYYDDQTPMPFRAIRLQINRDHLRELVSDLPESATQYKPGFLLDGNNAQGVDIRYRGDLPTNWMWADKSWRIKLKKKDSIDGNRLINLKHIPSELGGYVADLVIEKTDFPLRRQEIVRLYVNQEYKGLFRSFDQADESYLRNLGFMPGDLFVGENIGRDYLPRVYGNLFSNAFYWSKSGVNNKFPADYRPHLEELLDHLAARDYGALYRIIDYGNFADAWALCNLTGNGRMNNLHNWRLYFDYLDGRFKMVFYDTALGARPPGVGEVISADPFYVLLGDPRFVAATNLAMVRFLHDGALTAAATDLDQMAAEVEASALEAPDFVGASRAWASELRERQHQLEGELGEAELRFEQAGERLTLYYRGLLPLQLTGIEADSGPAGLVITRADGTPVEPEAERILPGRRFVRGFKKGSGNKWTELAFDRTELSIRRRDGRPAVVTGVRATIEGLGHPVQGRPLAAGEAATLSMDNVHSPEADKKPEPGRVYRFSGQARLDQDLVVREADRLEIAPGTRLVLGEGVSIIVRSRVDLEGVTFTGDPAHPWGILAIHGPQAEGSRVRGCRVEHGSHDVIDHVYYSGMLSVHYVPSVVIEHNQFGPNFIADDTIRVAVSDVEIYDNLIEDARSDAIDYDLSLGKLAGNRILRSGNDGMDLMTTKVEIWGNYFQGSGDKGISIGERSEPLVHDNVFDKCKSGIEVKDESLVLAANNVFIDNKRAISEYNKNWRYTFGGRAWIGNSLLRGNGVDAVPKARSKVIFERCAIEGKIEPEDLRRVRQLDPVETTLGVAEIRAALEKFAPSRTADLRTSFAAMNFPYVEGQPTPAVLAQQLPDNEGTYAEFFGEAAPPVPGAPPPPPRARTAPPERQRVVLGGRVPPRRLVPPVQVASTAPGSSPAR